MNKSDSVFNRDRGEEGEHREKRRFHVPAAGHTAESSAEHTPTGGPNRTGTDLSCHPPRRWLSDSWSELSFPHRSSAWASSPDHFESRKRSSRIKPNPNWTLFALRIAHLSAEKRIWRNVPASLPLIPEVSLQTRTRLYFQTRSSMGKKGGGLHSSDISRHPPPPPHGSGAVPVNSVTLPGKCSSQLNLSKQSVSARLSSVRPAIIVIFTLVKIWGFFSQKDTPVVISLVICHDGRK